MVPSGRAVPAAAAASTALFVGSRYLPALFATIAMLSESASVYDVSAYVIPPSVDCSAATTPELCSAPVPVGKVGCVDVPTLLFHSGLTRERYSVSTKL